MADQVAIQLPKTVYSEGGQFTATARFRDRAAIVDSIPTTVHYKLYNLSTEEIVRDWTSVTPAAEVSITVVASDNDVSNGCSVSERIEFIVAADRGLATQVLGVSQYTIKDIVGYG